MPDRHVPPPLPLPHERDEEGDTAHRPDPVIRQAHADIERGLVDTDLRATPGLDAERRDALVADAGVGPGPQPAAPDADKDGRARKPE